MLLLVLLHVTLLVLWLLLLLLLLQLLRLLLGEPGGMLALPRGEVCGWGGPGASGLAAAQGAAPPLQSRERLPHLS